MAKKKYDWQWEKLRRLAKTALPYECVNCGRIEPSLHLDHIISLAMGGPRLSLSNVQWLCYSCHLIKSNFDRRLLTEKRKRKQNYQTRKFR